MQYEGTSLKYFKCRYFIIAFLNLKRETILKREIFQASESVRCIEFTFLTTCLTSLQLSKARILDKD